MDSRSSEHEEKELIEQALAALAEESGARFELTSGDSSAPNHRPDFVITLKRAGIRNELAVEVKPRLTENTLGPVLQQLTTAGSPTVLVTRHANSKLAKRLREMGIQFIDQAGNAFLETPQFFLYIVGKKDKAKSTPLKARSFRRQGLTVVFFLLSAPKSTAATLRHIAESSGVSLGTVSNVIRDLTELGYVVGRRKDRRLINRRKLFDRWVVAFADQLRPSLVQGRFRSRESNWWKTARLGGAPGMYWSGAVGASRMMGGLRPGVATIYVRTAEASARLQLDYGLRRDEAGKTEILTAFWPEQLDPKGPPLAPPLLIYADLLALGDPREIAFANEFYDEKLSRHFGHD